MNKVLVAVKDNSAASIIRRSLGDRSVVTATDPKQALDLLQKVPCDLLMADADYLPELAGGQTNLEESLRQIHTAHPGLAIIVLTPQAAIRHAVAAVKAGADNYLTYPLEAAEVELVVGGLAELRQMESELSHYRDSFWRTELRKFVRTNSPMMREVLDKVQAVAPTKAVVLLQGETGTGKSLMAKLIHAHSNRSQGPFISVHCGSIPETLVESELFGHEKGAFTGAIKRKLGKFQLAQGGTIFLDEVGTMTKPVQIRLLEVLQEGSFSRVGGEETVHVDVRVVAASNVDLAKLVDEGAFRQDLYYRLNVFSLEMPPLRQRSEDIPLLVESFLDKLNQTHGKGLKGVAPQVIQALQSYSWPGNIRELENLLERAYILEKTQGLSQASFPSELFTLEPVTSGSADGETLPSLAEVRQRAVAEAERRYLVELLALNRGRIAPSAAMAGVTTRQLHNQMQKYNLRKEDFKQA